MAAKKGGLGKGLDALFADNAILDEQDATGAVTLPVSEIEPNRNQPRKTFDDGALAQLAESISIHGIIQPLLVRPLTDGSYQLVAGERRWRAARLAGLTQVPAVIRELSDSETMEIALVENLQREDLNPVEEAEGIALLMETYSLTQEEAAKRIGRSRPAVANALRLLKLPEPVLEMLKEEKLSSGHARALLSIEDPTFQMQAAQETVEKGLSVRDVERLAKRVVTEATPAPKERKRDSFFDEAQLALSEYFGRPVKVAGEKKGKIEIEFYGKEDLAALTRKLGQL